MKKNSFLEFSESTSFDDQKKKDIIENNNSEEIRNNKTSDKTEQIIINKNSIENKKTEQKECEKNLLLENNLNINCLEKKYEELEKNLFSLIPNLKSELNAQKRRLEFHKLYSNVVKIMICDGIKDFRTIAKIKNILCEKEEEAKIENNVERLNDISLVYKKLSFSLKTENDQKKLLEYSYSIDNKNTETIFLLAKYYLSTDNEQEGINLLKYASEKLNDGQASYLLGKFYIKKHLEKEKNKKKENFKDKNAEDSNLKEAFFYIKLGVKQGNPRALRLFGLINYEGLYETEKDIFLGINLLLKSAKYLNSPSIWKIWLIYNETKNEKIKQMLKNGFPSILENCTKAAKLLHNNSMRILNSVYDHGFFGVKHDNSLAYNYLLNSAKNFDIHAMLELAELHFDSDEQSEKTINELKEQDHSAMVFCSIAAEFGSVEAIYLLAKILKDGHGTIKSDKSTAEKWFALLLFDQTNMEISYKAARYLKKKIEYANLISKTFFDLANKNHTKSMIEIANTYLDVISTYNCETKETDEENNLVAKNIWFVKYNSGKSDNDKTKYFINQTEKAVNWLEKAIKNDSAEAMCILGELYISKNSIFKNKYEEGIRLLEKAKKAGVEEAGDILNNSNYYKKKEKIIKNADKLLKEEEKNISDSKNKKKKTKKDKKKNKHSKFSKKKNNSPEKEKADKLNTSIEKTEQTVEQKEEIIEKTEQTVEQKEEIIEKTEQTVEKIEETVEQKEEIIEKTEQIVEKIEETVEKIEETVEKIEETVEKIESKKVDLIEKYKFICAENKKDFKKKLMNIIFPNEENNSELFILSENGNGVKLYSFENNHLKLINDFSVSQKKLFFDFLKDFEVENKLPDGLKNATDFINFEFLGSYGSNNAVPSSKMELNLTFNNIKNHDNMINWIKNFKNSLSDILKIKSCSIHMEI